MKYTRRKIKIPTKYSNKKYIQHKYKKIKKQTKTVKKRGGNGKTTIKYDFSIEPSTIFKLLVEQYKKSHNKDVLDEDELNKCKQKMVEYNLGLNLLKVKQSDDIDLSKYGNYIEELIASIVKGSKNRTIIEKNITDKSTINKSIIFESSNSSLNVNKEKGNENNSLN